MTLWIKPDSLKGCIRFTNCRVSRKGMSSGTGRNWEEIQHCRERELLKQGCVFYHKSLLHTLLLISDTNITLPVWLNQMHDQNQCQSCLLFPCWSWNWRGGDPRSLKSNGSRTVKHGSWWSESARRERPRGCCTSSEKLSYKLGEKNKCFFLSYKC